MHAYALLCSCRSLRGTWVMLCIVACRLTWLTLGMEPLIQAKALAVATRVSTEWKLCNALLLPAETIQH